MPNSVSAPDINFDQSVKQSSTFVVTATPLPPLSDLARVWLDLESRAEGSFFTSWTWIGTWLTQLSDTGLTPDRLILITARRRDTVVGLGIACPAPRGWGLISPRRIFLHQTGRLPQDSIYIEYNDFLVDAAISHSARAACLQFLAARSDRGRLRINAAVQSMADALAMAAIPHQLLRVETCAYIDLTRAPVSAAAHLDAECEEDIGDELLMAATEAYLTGLSRNSRQQIRRALRLAERDGPLRLVHTTTHNDAAAALKDLIELHVAAWNKRKGLPGAFANPHQRQFVGDLVNAGIANGTVDLLRIKAGARTLGVLLNFVHRGQTYTYQSGFAYTDDNRAKPGLICHVLAATYYKLRGCRSYHFMAGAGRYKSSLSNATETLHWLEISHGGLLFRIEEEARALKQQLWRVLRPLNPGSS